MHEDNTQKHSASDSEKLSLILTSVQSLTVRFDNVDSRVNNIDSRVNNIDSRLLHVDQTVNELRDGVQELREGHLRLHETVLQVQEGQRQLQEGQNYLAADVRLFRQEVKERFLILSGATQADIKNLDKRVTRLELNSNPPDPQT